MQIFTGKWLLKKNQQNRKFSPAILLQLSKMVKDSVIDHVIYKELSMTSLPMINISYQAGKRKKADLILGILRSDITNYSIYLLLIVFLICYFFVFLSLTNLWNCQVPMTLKMLIEVYIKYLNSSTFSSFL